VKRPVLVVSDSHLYRQRLVGEIGRLPNHWVVSVPTWSAAVCDFVEEGTTELVVLDVEKPHALGIIALHQIRAISEVPVVFMEAPNAPTRANGAVAKDAGASVTIRKPALISKITIENWAMQTAVAVEDLLDEKLDPPGAAAA
jgi:chemotaxis response regulator CheB